MSRSRGERLFLENTFHTPPNNVVAAPARFARSGVHGA